MLGLRSGHDAANEKAVDFRPMVSDRDGSDPCAVRLLRRFAGRWQSAMADLLFPPRCLGCGTHLLRSPASSFGLTAPDSSPDECSRLMAPYFCLECAGGFRPVASPICSMCGIVFESRSGQDHLCGSCIRRPRPFATARAVGLYDGVLKKAIHGLKYGGKRQLARPLGRLLEDARNRYWPAGAFDAIVPVPLHTRRLRQRGFNQAALVIRQWQNGSAGHGEGGLSGLLTRSRNTLPQAGLGRVDRIANIRNAFSVSRPERVRGKRLLVVDDVFTTGATVEEGARVLLAAGAVRVDVLTLARV